MASISEFFTATSLIDMVPLNDCRTPTFTVAPDAALLAELPAPLELDDDVELLLPHPAAITRLAAKRPLTSPDLRRIFIRSLSVRTWLFEPGRGAT
jgi:hypothetical protein